MPSENDELEKEIEELRQRITHLTRELDESPHAERIAAIEDELERVTERLHELEAQRG